LRLRFASTAVTRAGDRRVTVVGGGCGSLRAARGPGAWGEATSPWRVSVGCAGLPKAEGTSVMLPKAAGCVQPCFAKSFKAVNWAQAKMQEGWVKVEKEEAVCQTVFLCVSLAYGT